MIECSGNNKSAGKERRGCVTRGWAENRSSLVFWLLIRIRKQEEGLNTEQESFTTQELATDF